MSLERRPLRFQRFETQPVIDEMVKLAGMGDGRGWLNLQPLLADEDRIPESPVFRLFTAKGPSVPLGTWVPGYDYRDKWQPASVGLQHPGGRHASQRLVDRGLAEPAGWNRRQDHIKRGLVYELPHGENPEKVLEFLMEAMARLVDFPLRDRWMATVLVQS